MADKYNFGSFECVTAEIISSSGATFDLMKPENSIMNITIYEDIQSHAVTGDIIIRDITNFSSIGPLIGQEYLKLKLKTNTLKDEDENVFDFTKNPFLINSIESRTKIGNNIQVLVLSFSSDSLSKNNRTKVTRTLNGTYSDIVKTMFEEMSSGKKCYIEPTVGIKKITSPNIRPADIIRLAMRESVSKFLEDTISNYVFFETLKAFHFRSIPSLYAQPFKQNYTTYAPGSMPRNTTNDNLDERELSRIINFTIGSGNDTLIHHLSGTYASNLIVHDVFNKTVTKNTYNYFKNFRKEKHIGSYHGKDSNPVFSTRKIETNKRVSDFPARTFVVPVSKNGNNNAYYSTPFDTNIVSASNPQDYLQQRVSQINQLENGISMIIEVHGNTIVSAGDIVHANIPYTGIKTQNKEENDIIYSGEFLVKRVRHDFDYVLRTHKTDYVLVKDSVEELFPNDKDEDLINNSRNSFISSKDDFYPKNSKS
tara:strand:+ start:1453 stop:2895 length:1443 start_codon:yes stop_codon:yes gene_type:complete